MSIYKPRPPPATFEVVTGFPAATGYLPQHQPSKLCKGLMFALLIIFLIFVVAALVISISPHISIFHVSSLSLSNFNTSTSPSFITGNWDLELTVENTDKKLTLHYQEINASVFYKDVLILQTTLSQFNLTKKNQTVVRGRLATEGANVNAWVVDDISKDRTNGSVKFDLELKVNVEYDWYVMHAMPEVKIYCAGLELGLTEAAGNATLVGKGDRDCVVSNWSSEY